MLDPIKDIVRLSGLPDPALHVLLGLAIFFVSAAVFRKSWGSSVPWLITLGFQLINEVADLALDISQGEIIRWRGGLLDTAVTMFLPTLLLVFSNLTKRKQHRTGSDQP